MVIQRAIKKYGRDAFRWKILADGLTKKEAIALEIELIAKIPSELKYNVALGGEGVHGIPWTEERKRRHSAAMAGRRHSGEALANMRASLSARQHLLPRKKVVCLDDGLIYKSVTAAAAYYGVAATAICRICIGKGKKTTLSAHGKHFAYYDKEFSEEERRNLIAVAELKSKSARGIRRRPVICLNDSRIYQSVHETASAYNISPGSVSGCCRRGVQTISGLRFIYADQKTPVVQKLPTRKKIINLTSGIIYESGTAAAKATGRSLTAVMISIKLNRKCAGQRFAYAA